MILKEIKINIIIRFNLNDIEPKLKKKNCFAFFSHKLNIDFFLNIINLE